ncbi:NrdR family transcriptional regulator [Asticcacaulis sp. AC466]|uniref:NrdR family transcriptional regulator n=1 Tax=Asticcacaulis sp. AC466 TaxID=1282362 RepID=UPI002684E2FF
MPQKLGPNNKHGTSEYDGVRPKCEKCGGDKSSIKDSRPHSGTIRRRRHCAKCGHTWTTYEIARSTFLDLRRKIRDLRAKLKVQSDETGISQ